MSRVTGTGCMTTSLVAACCGAMGLSLASVTAGVLVMGLAGEKARSMLREGEGTGMFRTRLMDAVSNMTAEDIVAKGQCSLE